MQEKLRTIKPRKGQTARIAAALALVLIIVLHTILSVFAFSVTTYSSGTDIDSWENVPEQEIYLSGFYSSNISLTVSAVDSNGNTDSSALSTAGNCIKASSNAVDADGNVTYLPYCLMIYSPPGAAGSWYNYDEELDATVTFTLTFAECGYDSDGDVIDMVIQGGNISVFTESDASDAGVRWGSALTLEGEGRSYMKYGAAYARSLSSDGNGLSVGTYGVSGIKMKLIVTFYKTGSTSTRASGSYLMVGNDIDELSGLGTSSAIHSSYTVNGNSKYGECVWLGSAFSDSTLFAVSDSIAQYSGSGSPNTNKYMSYYASGSGSSWGAYIAAAGKGNYEQDDGLDYTVGFAIDTGGKSFSLGMYGTRGKITLFGNFNPHTVTASISSSSADGGGRIASAKIGSVSSSTYINTCGDSFSKNVQWKNTVTYTITCNTGYKISSLKVNGETISSYTGATGTQTYTTDAITSDTTIEVTFAPLAYTITYNSNTDTPSTDTQTFTYGNTATIRDCSFTWDGYEFQYWNTTSSDSGTTYNAGSSYGSAANLTLYAIWKQISFPYTIVYNANGGEGVDVTRSVAMMEDHTVLSDTTTGFTYNGYKFAGWNTAADGSGTAYAAGSTIAAPGLGTCEGEYVYLYAMWEPVTYNITYDPNSGTVTDEDTMVDIEDIVFNEDVTIEECTYAAPSNMYVFGGWAVTPDGGVVIASNVTTINAAQDLTDYVTFCDDDVTVTLYAVWNVKTWLYDYVSTSDIYDPDTGYYQVELDDGTVVVYEIPTNDDGTLWTAEQCFPADPSENPIDGNTENTGYWYKISDGTWAYMFYVEEEEYIYYTYEEDLTSILDETFEGDYVILNPYTIEDGSDSDAQITNEDGDFGALKITKTVSTTGESSTDTFKIKITLCDEDGSLLSGTTSFGSGADAVSFIDGVTYRTISDGETVTIEDIPAGYIYTVEEVPDDDQYYEVSYAAFLETADSVTTAEDVSVSDDGVTGTIVCEDGGSEVTATVVHITNTGDGSGGLMISKVVADSDGSDADDDAFFTVRVTLTDASNQALSGTTTYGYYTFTDGVLETSVENGTSLRIKGIPAGYHYTVEEIAVGGEDYDDQGVYTVMYSDESGTVSTDPITGVIEAYDEDDEIAEANIVLITNTTDGTGRLRIFKQVTSEDGTEIDSNEAFNITITLSDKEGSLLTGTKTFGMCTFVDGVCETTIKDNNDTDYDDDEDGTIIELTDIPVGYQYSVTEELTDEQAEKYETVYVTANEGTIQEYDEDDDDTISVVTINNTTDEKWGSLTIEKKIDGWYETDDNIYEFVLSFGNLENRTYSITYCYSAGGETKEARDGSDESITANADGEATAVIFLAANETACVDGLPIGTTYQVTEAAGDYQASYVITDESGVNSIVQESGSAEEGKSLQTQVETIDEDDDGEIENVTVTFTNTLFKTKDVILKKQSLDKDGNEDTDDETAYMITAYFKELVSGESYLYSDADGEETEYLNADEEGSAQVTLILSAGDEYCFYELPVGASYQFVEAENRKLASYEITDEEETDNIAEAGDSNEHNHTDLSTDEEQVNEGEEITVTFINTSNSADVRIRKVNTDGTPLAGAVFALYQVAGENDLTGVDEEDDEEDILLYDYILTSSDEGDDYGWSDVIEGLEVGSYYFIEVEAPDGYTINDTVLDFEITEDDIDTLIELQVKDNELLVLASSGGIGVHVLVVISLILAVCAAAAANRMRRRRLA